MTRATFSIIENLLKDMTAAEILKNGGGGLKSRTGTNNSLVWYTIPGRIFELLCNYKSVLAKKHASLRKKLARLRHKNAALKAEVYQIQKK